MPDTVDVPETADVREPVVTESLNAHRPVSGAGRLRIDVVIPVKDDARLLARCLASLRAQRHPAASIIVVDNGSDDLETVRALTERFGARLIHEETPGIPAANATGFDHATAPVIARLDADCVAPTDWLERIAAAFDADAELAAVTGSSTFIDGPVLLRAPLATLYLGSYRLFVTAAIARTPLFGSNCAIRASTWRQIRGRVHRGDAELHDDLDVSVHLGTGRRVRYDGSIRMGISMRPFTSFSSPLARSWRGWHTLAIHWPIELPVLRWLRRAYPERFSPGTSTVPWRERSRLVRWARLLRTSRPRTFRQKVRYKMLRDHRALIVTFADKAAVRDHVASLIGPEYLPEAYAILDDAAELAALDLPDAYVVKPTHGSGAAVVVSETAPADARLPEDAGSWEYRHVRPAAADRAQLVRLGAGWLEQLYGQGPNREWVYGMVPRRIIVEELLEGPGGGIPDDLKLFVFHGRCRWVQVDSGRFGRRTQDFFTPDWQHVPLSGGPPWAEPEPAAPARLDEMIDLAERLATGTDFVRVDLYDLGDRIVFGELTSFPAGGDSPFEPESFNERFGRVWTVPRRYR